MYSGLIAINIHVNSTLTDTLKKSNYAKYEIENDFRFLFHFIDFHV